MSSRFVVYKFYLTKTEYIKVVVLKARVVNKRCCCCFSLVGSGYDQGARSSNPWADDDDFGNDMDVNEIRQHQQNLVKGNWPIIVAISIGLLSLSILLTVSD